MLIAQLVVAFGTAALFSTLELITRDYPRTFSLLLRKSWFVALYATIYGVLAAGAVFILDVLIVNKYITLEGLGLSSPLVRAFVVGLLAKALLHLRLFTATIGTQSVPIGVETILQTFEPWLLKTIELEHFNAVREFLVPYVARYKNIKEIRDLLKNNLPTALTPTERKALITGSRKGGNPTELLQDYLQLVGKRNFVRVFKLD